MIAHPSLSHCFLVLVKDLGPGLDPLTMKLVPCLNSVFKRLCSQFLVRFPVYCLYPVLVMILNYEIGSLLDFRISVIQKQIFGKLSF